MAPGCYRFESFRLDRLDRRLLRDDAPVELNARYFDALALLVSEQGRLVSKDRFLEEVWRGVPVTDEALTQCIRTLRRQLGDDAARPRFIETVPKHGYRFIAPVDAVDSTAGRSRPAAAPKAAEAPHALLIGLAGLLGGGVAGALGGLVYGFAGASQPLQPGLGAVSVLLVLWSLTVVVALMGAAGVSFGIALASSAGGRGWQWTVGGGAAGGLLVGAVVKLLGIDAFNLLLGRSPGDITGAAEGLAIGAAVGLGAWIAGRLEGPRMVRRAMAAAGALGAAGGLAVVLLGGRLMGGSLDLLTRQFPGSRLRMDQLGGLVGESGFGPRSQAVTGALEGLLFAACVVGAMTIARRRLADGQGSA